MTLGLRIFLVYLLFISLTGYFVLSTVMKEIRPGVRQSTEETLVDTANLLAEILRDDFKAGTLSENRWPQLLRAYGERQPAATIWGLPKNQVNHRIYVTDAKGIVVLDSSGLAKPNSSLQPYVDRTERRLLWYGAGLIAMGLLFGALLSWWLSAALRRMTAYALAVSEGRRAELPHYRGGEMEQLATAVEHMRTQLEGKAYVERYVHTLTHELKSPLAAIRGAAELLQGEMPLEQRQRFVGNIDSESARMQQLIERLLNLAQVEQRQGLEEQVNVPLAPLCKELLNSQHGRIEGKQLQVELRVPADLAWSGEPFLLRQALGNLLTNALDFSPVGGLLRCSAQPVEEGVELVLFNQGEPIPDYALPRLCERFYSLPRPDSGRKSTGLGLNFVEEVVQLHGGQMRIDNVPGGVQVTLRLP
jgi:two-component system sensor histidine kinase CreC